MLTKGFRKTLLYNTLSLGTLLALVSSGPAALASSPGHTYPDRKDDRPSAAQDLRRPPTAQKDDSTHAATAFPLPRGHWAIEGTQLQSPTDLPAGDGHSVVWRETLDVSPSSPQTLAISLQLDTLQLSSQDVLILRGTSGQVQILTKRDNQKKSSGVRWTPAVPGRVVSLELITGPQSKGAQVSVNAWRSWIPEYSEHSTTIVTRTRSSDENSCTDPTETENEGDTESTDDQYGSYDLVRIASAPTEVYNERGPVARIDTGSGYCTGFLISADLLMTNYHCVGYQSTCDSTRVQFNYELDSNLQPTPIAEVSCTTLVKANSTYDYAVLKLSSAIGNTYGWYELEPRVPTGEQGTLIQHPNGRRKKVALPPNCALLEIADGYAPNSDFRHQCDTDSGTSGAPILDSEYYVVGLHHWGGASKSGGDTANQAVRMDHIVRDCTVCP